MLGKKWNNFLDKLGQESNQKTQRVNRSKCADLAGICVLSYLALSTMTSETAEMVNYLNFNASGDIKMGLGFRQYHEGWKYGWKTININNQVYFGEYFPNPHWAYCTSIYENPNIRPWNSDFLWKYLQYLIHNDKNMHQLHFNGIGNIGISEYPYISKSNTERLKSLSENRAEFDARSAIQGWICDACGCHNNTGNTKPYTVLKQGTQKITNTPFSLRELSGPRTSDHFLHEGSRYIKDTEPITELEHEKRRLRKWIALRVANVGFFLWKPSKKS